MAPHNHYTNYYLAQAGSGMGTYFAGSAYQKGYGLGSWLGGLFRSVLPLFKSGAAAIGREAARAGAHVLADVASGDNLAESARRHSGQAINTLAKRMGGSGSIKRRRKPLRSHNPKRARTVRTPITKLVDQLS